MPTTILDNETYPEALQRRYAEETKAEKQAEIIRMAEKACAPHQILNTDLVFLERFFNLAFAAGAAHEREACAKVCEQGTGEAVQTATLEILLRERKRIAKAIRTRGAK